MYQYAHGGDIYSARKKQGNINILDFSVNINPLGLPAAVKEAIVQALAECAEYPDHFCRELVAALAEYEQTSPNHIFCGNGASDIIFRLALALKPKKALLLAPTFGDYEKALNTVGCAISYYDLSEEQDFCIQPDFLNYVTSETDIVIICNPNNPTGELTNKLFLQQVLDKCRQTNTFVLMDECFMDFIAQPDDYSVRAYIQDYPNLMILKAFTKIFAMAGIRLGYGLTSNTALMEQLHLAGQDWGVSSVAQNAGVVALKQKDYLKETACLIRQERAFLMEELEGLGFRIFGSKANYIFFKTGEYQDLDQRLFAKGILIRSCANYVNLSSEYFRVAVKSHADNLKLIAALKDVMI